MKKIIFTLAFLASIDAATADYQNIAVQDYYGGEKLVPLVNLKNFNFSDNSINFNYIGDTTNTISLAGIRKMYFRTTTSGIIERSQKPSYSVYPNPSINEIFINGIKEYPAEISIYDFAGNKLKSLSLANENSAIAVGELASGVYLIKLNNHILKFEKNEK